MSTKTSIKRVALVAVSALGFGLLSVMPAKAAPTVLTVTAGTQTFGGSNTVPTVGSSVRIPVSLAINWDDAAAAESITIVGSIAGPNNSTATVTADVTGAAAVFTTVTAGEIAPSASAATISYTTPTTGIDVVASLIGGMNFTPDVPGNYVITLAPSVGATAGTSRTVNVNVSGVAWTQAQSGLGLASATQVAGRLATATFNIPAALSDTLFQVTTSTGMGIAAANYGTANLGATASNYTTNTNIVKANGTNFADGFTYTSGTITNTEAIAGDNYDTDIETVSVQVTAPTTAGIYTISFRSVAPLTGVVTTRGTATLTVVASGTTAISAANSTIGVQSAACPAASTSKTGDEAALTNASPASSTAANGGTLNVCIYTRDGNGNLINVVAANSNVVTTLGAIEAETDAVSSQDLTLTGVATQTGKSTITAVLVDGAGAAITLSTEVTFFGSLTSLTLTNSTFAAQYFFGLPVGVTATSTAAPIGHSTSGVGRLLLVGRDANGNQIDLNAATNSTTNFFTVDSDAIATAPAAGTTQTAGATVASAYAASNLATWGANEVRVFCTTSAKAEKLTITAHGRTSTGALVSSDPVTFHCSDNTVAAGTVTVTPAATTLAAGASTTFNISVLDSFGYPVPDGTTPTLAVNNGAALVTPSTTTRNGVFRFDGTLIAGNQGPITLTVVGPIRKAATASIAVTGGSQDAANAAADAAAEAIDAANAATDAANLAAEAADAATVAAEEARDAADAATAAVEELSTQVATLLAGLRAQITTLANTVAKIAKRVRA